MRLVENASPPEISRLILFMKSAQQYSNNGNHLESFLASSKNRIKNVINQTSQIRTKRETNIMPNSYPNIPLVLDEEAVRLFNLKILKTCKFSE